VPSNASKLILVLALVAGSLAIAAPAANAVPTKTVKATTGNGWQPQRVRLVRQNGKGIIKWTNPTGTPHDVRSLNTGKNWTMSPKNLETSSGNVVKRTFKKRGTYYFRCTRHSFLSGGKWTGMVGKVIVR
jgi:plastocyanin